MSGSPPDIGPLRLRLLLTQRCEVHHVQRFELDGLSATGARIGGEVEADDFAGCALGLVGTQRYTSLYRQGSVIGTHDAIELSQMAADLVVSCPSQSFSWPPQREPSLKSQTRGLHKDKSVCKKSSWSVEDLSARCQWRLPATGASGPACDRVAPGPTSISGVSRVESKPVRSLAPAQRSGSRAGAAHRKRTLDAARCAPKLAGSGRRFLGGLPPSPSGGEDTTSSV